jgi:hypothetical protein
LVIPFLMVMRHELRNRLSLPNTLFVFELLMLRPSVDTLPQPWGRTSFPCS